MESNSMCSNCSSNPVDLHEHMPCCGSLICSTCSRSGSCKLNLNSSITISCKVCGLPSSKDGNQLIERLLVRAQEGLAWAQADAGEYYFVSRGEAGTPEFVSKISSALRCFSFAATQGNLKAQYYLGLCFLNGIGLDTDALQGLELIQIAASKGYKVAQEYLCSSSTPTTTVTDNLNINALPMQPSSSSTFDTPTPFQNTNNINNTMMNNNFYNQFMIYQLATQIAMNPSMIMALPFLNQNLASIGSGALPNSFDNMNNNSMQMLNPNFLNNQISMLGGGHGMNPFMNNNVNTNNNSSNNTFSRSTSNSSTSSYASSPSNKMNSAVSTNYNMKIKARATKSKTKSPTSSVNSSYKSSDAEPIMNDNLSLLGRAVETLEKKSKRKRADDEDYKVEAYNSDASNNSDYSPSRSTPVRKRKVPSQYRPRQVQNSQLIEFSGCNEYNQNSNVTPFLSKLKRLVNSSGTKFNRLPVVGGILLDLEKLFVIVQQHGGIEKVTRALMWRSVAARMNIPVACTSAGHLLRKYYTSLLLPHEEELIKFMMLREPQSMETNTNMSPTFLEIYKDEAASNTNSNGVNSNKYDKIESTLDLLNNPILSSFIESGMESSSSEQGTIVSTTTTPEEISESEV